MKITMSFVVIIMMIGCSNHEDPTPEFKIENNAGIWVPYELDYDDGSTWTSLSGNSVIGVYSESFALRKDKTYSSVIWTPTSQNIRTDEGGTVSYDASAKILHFVGTPWNIDFQIVSYTGTELWMRSMDTEHSIPVPNAVYKFKQQQKF